MGSLNQFPETWSTLVMCFNLEWLQYFLFFTSPCSEENSQVQSSVSRIELLFSRANGKIPPGTKSLLQRAMPRRYSAAPCLKSRLRVTGTKGKTQWAIKHCFNNIHFATQFVTGFLHPARLGTPNENKQKQSWHYKGLWAQQKVSDSLGQASVPALSLRWYCNTVTRKLLIRAWHSALHTVSQIWLAGPFCVEFSPWSIRVHICVLELTFQVKRPILYFCSILLFTFSLTSKTTLLILYSPTGSGSLDSRA